MADAASLRGEDARPVELAFVAPGVDELDVGAFPDVGALPIGAETGEVGHITGVVGDETGVVGDETGAVGDETGAVGDETGAVGDETGVVGVETGTTPGGGDVGVDGVGVGLAGDATGVGPPEGDGEAGGCAVVGVGVGAGAGVGLEVGAGLGAGVAAAAGTASKENAFPLVSTATHDEAEKHDTAFRFAKRSSREGADQEEPSYPRSFPKASTAVHEVPTHEIPVSPPKESIGVAAVHVDPL